MEIVGFKSIVQSVCRLISEMLTEKELDLFKKLSNKEWTEIYNFLKFNNLLPLFYSKLLKLKLKEFVPDNVLFTLQRDYNAFSCTTIKRQHELSRILKVFNDKKIDVILLKGVLIGNEYYDNPTERPMSDIDLLIKENNIGEAISILKNFGCSLQDEYNLDLVKKFSRHLSPIKTPLGFYLELHIKLSSDTNDFLLPTFDIKALWETKRLSIYNGAKCFSLKLEYMLIHLCHHISADLFKQKLLQIYDVALIIQKVEIDWSFLFETAKEWKCLKPLHSVLITANKIYGLNIDNYISYLSEAINIDYAIINSIEKILFKNQTDFDSNKEKNTLVSILEGKKGMKKFRYIFWTFFNRDKIIYQHNYSNKTKIPGIWLYFKRIKYLVNKYKDSFIELYIKQPTLRRDISSLQAETVEQLKSWFKEN